MRMALKILSYRSIFDQKNVKNSIINKSYKESIQDEIGDSGAPVFKLVNQEGIANGLIGGVNKLNLIKIKNPNYAFGK